MTEGTDMNQIEKALAAYLGEVCGMQLQPHALTGLSQAAIAAMQPAPQEAVMQSDIVQRLEALIERQRNARGDMLYKGSADPELVDARAEITRLTEALRAAEEREKGLRGLFPHFDRLALAVAQFGPHSGFHDWWTDAKEYRAALKGPSHDK